MMTLYVRGSETFRESQLTRSLGRFERGLLLLGGRSNHDRVRCI